MQNLDYKKRVNLQALTHELTDALPDVFRVADPDAEGGYRSIGSIHGVGDTEEGGFYPSVSIEVGDDVDASAIAAIVKAHTAEALPAPPDREQALAAAIATIAADASLSKATRDALGELVGILGAQ